MLWVCWWMCWRLAHLMFFSTSLPPSPFRHRLDSLEYLVARILSMFCWHAMFYQTFCSFPSLFFSSFLLLLLLYVQLHSCVKRWCSLRCFDDCPYAFSFDASNVLPFFSPSFSPLFFPPLPSSPQCSAVCWRVGAWDFVVVTLFSLLSLLLLWASVVVVVGGAESLYLLFSLFNLMVSLHDCLFCVCRLKNRYQNC